MSCLSLQETDKKDMAGDVAAIDLAPVPEGRQRSRFLAVGSYDSTIRVLSLDPADTMKARGTPCSAQRSAATSVFQRCARAARHGWFQDNKHRKQVLLHR